MYVLRKSKKGSKVIALFDANNFGDFTLFSIITEEEAQEIANSIDDKLLTPYSFSCSDIIQSFIIELL